MKLTVASELNYRSMIRKLNMACGQKECTILTDYGGIITSNFKGDIYIPGSNQDCIDLLLKEPDHRRFTCRGSGHSMHGRSIPGANKHLLVTSSLNQIHFSKPGLVSVQAGVQIGVLQAFLQRYGWFLPVFPEAIQTGPTVAGYFLAGGFGSHSPQYGGFWDNVESITCIYPGNFESSEIHKSHDLFWDLSGSGGHSNCIITELKINIKKFDNNSKYPMGLAITLPTLQPERSSPIIWFTLFVPLADQQVLLRKYRNMLSTLSTVLQLVTPRSVKIKFYSRFPTFLKDFTVDLFAFSIGGKFPENQPDGAILACQYIGDLADSLPNCIQYHSSELALDNLFNLHCS